MTKSRTLANTVSTGGLLDDGIVSASEINGSFPSLTVSGTATLPTAVITGGSIDGTVIGATTPVDVNGTTAIFSDSLLVATTISNPGNGNTTTGLAFSGDSLHLSRASEFCLMTNRNDSGRVVSIRRSGTQVGSISVTSSATAYNTSSDYRLKENIVPLSGAANRLAQIPVYRFNFIADNDNTVDGFLAHEVQPFIPEAITGTKDEVDAEGNPVYQGIDQSKLVPLLTAALQEAIQRIEALEAQLAS